MGLVNKGGNAHTLQITIGETPQLLHIIRIGQPGLLGGSNYGSTNDERFLYTGQANQSSPNDTTSVGRVSQYPVVGVFPENLPPALNWYSVTKPGVVFTYDNSYLVKYDILEGKVIWERLTNLVVNNLPTHSKLTMVNDVLIVNDATGLMQLIDSQTSKTIKSFDLGRSGQSGASIAGNQIFNALGRGSLQSPGNNYHPTQHLTVFQLP